MRNKKLLIASAALIIIVAIYLIISMNMEEPSDYVFEMEYRIADFSDGIDRQKEILQKVDLNNISSLDETTLMFFYSSFSALWLQIMNMEEPNEEDLQEFHKNFTNLVFDYEKSSHDFVEAAKNSDISAFNNSEEEMINLIKEYNEMYDRLEQLKQKYY